MRARTFMSFAFVLFLPGLLVGPPQARAVDIVRDGKPLATIVVQSPADATPAGGKKRTKVSADERAARVLVEWVQKMTGAELPVADTAPKNGPAIFVGAAALQAGLKLDGLDSPSREGLRVVSDGRRVLLAGQDDTSTIRAACRLLEHWGCRYYMDHALGEVYPKTPTLSVGKVDLQEKPGLLYRNIWGSQWSGESLWKIWNGAGGVSLGMAHAWGGYLSKDLFREHPEYFRLRDGQREPSDWFCTSNPGLREAFAKAAIEKIKNGQAHPSLSPPDGRGYCECDTCRAQDDPHSVEPSSGTVAVSNRYADFYQDVARRVAKACPDAILNFYCYADYTQAPTSGIKLEPNLCAWIAPIRYCRFHRIGDPGCPSRWQLQDLIDGWAGAAKRIGYRTYNYNLAECCVPFSLLSVWRHDIPYLHERDCIGNNLETLANWQIYGPHIYLSIRLAYDPQADAAAVMDEYYVKFYGPAAGPLLREYWTAIDRAFVDLRTHSGSFYALHLVYTPEFLQRLADLLQRAGAAARSDETYAARVAMTAEGLKNAQQYSALRDAMNRGDFAGAKRTYDELLARNETHAQSRLGNHYTVNYLKRFLGKQLEAGVAAVAAPNRLVQVLPDQWRLQYDPREEGEAKGYPRPDFNDWAWTTVATFGNPLEAQRLPDRQTILWYRTVIDVDAPTRKPALFFTEVDGDARVWVNGKAVGASEKKRVPFQLDVSSALTRGRNVIAVQVDHRTITDLFLGGILRPVLLIETGAKP